MAQSDQVFSRSGLGAALGAHLVWGLLPLYLHMIREVPAFELVGWRVIFTLPFCLLFIALRRQHRDLAAALQNPKVLRTLILSAAMIAINWVIYIVAIQQGQVFAASLGYYLTPLLQVLAGTVLLKERLTRLQWIAVALAIGGVTLLSWGAIELLWVSLALALSWTAYGFVRKQTPVGALPGLTVETLVLLPAGLAVVGWFAITPPGSSLTQTTGLTALIAASGLLTAIPLTLHAVAARRLDFTLLGMLQFTSPTLVFGLGVTVFGIPLDSVQLVSFTLIWIAIGLFVWDLVSRSRAARSGV